MKLGELILQYRSENHISQREFARRSGLSNSLISIIEKGYNPQTGKEPSPDLATYSRIAQAMDITVQSLFEQLGDDATVRLTPSMESDTPIIIPDSDKFRQIMDHMTPTDYVTVWEAFDRTYKRMKENGEID